MSDPVAVSGTPRRIPGVGLDIGTMFLVVAGQSPDGQVSCRKIRDAFLEVDQEDSKMLRLSKISCVHRGENVFVVGDDALAAANLFKRSSSGEEQRLRRPIKGGIISPTESAAQDVLQVIIDELLGAPVSKGEKVVFSVPAAPIDVPGQDVVYHEGIFRKIVNVLGYEAESMNEAEAVIYSECAETQFSGIATSFGSGMSNTTLCYKALRGMSFSVARGGDWIDAQAAGSVNSTSSRCCAIKERGLDLRDPAVGEERTQREREALALYYRAHIRYVVANTARQFQISRDEFELPGPVPWILSGGTSLVTGFKDVFDECLALEKKRSGFPIEISEVRMAKNPLDSVARGLLVAALL